MIQPILDRILVQVIPNPTETRGGIIIPNLAQEKPLRGIIKASGPGRITTKGELIPNSLKPGDHIIFSKYAGFDVKEDNVMYKMMNEQDVLCTYEPEDDVEGLITKSEEVGELKI